MILKFLIVYTMYNMAKDPVCGMNVDESTAQYTSEVNGQKVYLCCSDCKEKFDKDPQKYGY